MNALRDFVGIGYRWLTPMFISDLKIKTNCLTSSECISRYRHDYVGDKPRKLTESRQLVTITFYSHYSNWLNVCVGDQCVHNTDSKQNAFELASSPPSVFSFCHSSRDELKCSECLKTILFRCLFFSFSSEKLHRSQLKQTSRSLFMSSLYKWSNNFIISTVCVCVSRHSRIPSLFKYRLYATAFVLFYSVALPSVRLGVAVEMIEYRR